MNTTYIKQLKAIRQVAMNAKGTNTTNNAYLDTLIKCVDDCLNEIDQVRYTNIPTQTEIEQLNDY